MSLLRNFCFLLFRETALSSSASTLWTRSCSRSSLSSHWRPNRWMTSSPHVYSSSALVRWCGVFPCARVSLYFTLSSSVDSPCFLFVFCYHKCFMSAWSWSCSTVSAGRICSGGDQVDTHRLFQQQGGLWPHWIQTGETSSQWTGLRFDERQPLKSRKKSLWKGLIRSISSHVSQCVSYFNVISDGW